MVVNAEALGPVRFAGWDHRGYPLGRPVTSPYIPCISTEEGQATDNVYGVVEFMLREGAISRTEGLDVGLTRTYLPGGGKIQPVTARASSKDGGKETFALVDETHLFTTPDLIRLHATVRRNLAKRRQAEPWCLETSTMYAMDEGSVAESSHHYAQKVAEGAITDSGFVFDHRQGSAEFEWDDDDQLRAALVEAYGEAAHWMDIERLIAEIRDPQTTEADARRYFLNQPSRRSTAWLGTGAWTRCADPDREWPEDREPIVLGFDGSYDNDSTGLVGCTLDGHLFVIDVWEKPERERDWIVPRDEVDWAVDAAMQRWQVLELCPDPNGWHGEVAKWEHRYGDVVVRWRPEAIGMVSAACSEFYSAVLNQTLSHDGDLRLQRHLSNATVKETPEGAYIRKEGRRSPRKIDLAYAAVIAYARAMWHGQNKGGGYATLDDEAFQAALNS
jgi:phage terminase large subunit-like protein